jgi:adenylate cyclase
MADDSAAKAAREDAAQGRLTRLREAAVRMDSHPTVLGAVERLRRRVPGDAKFGDRLSTSDHKPASLVARGVSAVRAHAAEGRGSAARPSALHEFGMGALQVWQSLAESAGRGRGEREVTIVFTDLVGFSSWALQAGDEAALELLREVGDLVEEAFFAHGGTIVKRLGDGVMAVFDDPANAVEAALAAQDGLAGVEVGGHRPKMRAGVHHGCPRKVGGDYLGVDVNVAARVAEQAKGGEVLVSDPTFAALDPEAGLAGGRARRLKADGAPRDLCVRPVSRAA